MSRTGLVKEVINLDTGEVFRSTKEAAKKYHTTQNNIWYACNGKFKKAVGYRWAYTGNTIKDIGSSRKVKNIDTGEVFNSATEARKNFGISDVSKIIKCCKYKQKNNRWV